MLSFAEKRAIQASIIEQNKILTGKPSFAEKRQAQKAKTDALAKLGKVVVKQPSRTEVAEIADVGKNSELQSNSDQANIDLENLIKIAADSVESLRKPDVFRVLDSNPDHLTELAAYISEKRPDLAQEVSDVLSELSGDNGNNGNNEINLVPDDLTPEEIERVKQPTEKFYNFDPNRKTGQRKKDNKAAMEILSKIDSGEIDPAALTDEQREALAKYSGTGGNLEAANGKKGSAYEYYTPKPIAESMWDLMKELGFTGGKVLDPSSGVGIFGGTAPTNAAVDAVELSSVSGRINGLVNSGPGNAVTISPFEAVAAATPDESYDAIITNVPFGSNSARGGNQMLDKRYQNESLENYFILRSLEKLKPGGLAVFITPPRCVSGKKDNERSMRQRASYKAEFLGAYRLPNSVFGTADADTITDVIAFRKYSREVLDKIEELREQSPGTLEKANVLWPEYIGGDYFKGEGRRFILGEFIPKDPNDIWDRAQVVNTAPVGDIAKMIRKFPGSRVDWAMLEAAETAPIIYQEGDTITQAGETLVMRDGQWVAVKKPAKNTDMLSLLANIETPYSAFINNVSYESSMELVEYLSAMSRSLDIPDWLRIATSKLNGMPEYWRAGLVGLSVAQVLNQQHGEPINYLEEYPALSDAMERVYPLAKSIPNGLSGNLKDGIKQLITHYSKKKGFSAVWKGDVNVEVDNGKLTEDQSFEGLRYRTKSQWVPVSDAKTAIGEDFDPMTSSEYCLSGDGQSVTKAGDYYVGNYGEFLRKINREIDSSDGALKDKLLRQKLDAEQHIDRIDPNALTFNLFSPYITIEEKAEFLRRFVDPRFNVSIEYKGETVDPYIVWEGSNNDDSDKAKLMRRFAAYCKNGTVTLGGAKLSVTTKQGLAELRKMVSTANEQFGPWVKSNKGALERITKLTSDPDKLRFIPIEDESAITIPGLSKNKTPHGYQYAFIRKQGREFGGINGFDVGLGKTLTSLAAVQHVHNIGVKKKTAFVVPNSVLSNWRKEAISAYESIDDCLFIGLRANKAGKFTVKSSSYDEDLTRIIENRHAKIFMSMEAFERIRLRDITIEDFATYMRKVDASFAESEKNAEEEAKKSKLAKLMEGLRTKTGSSPYLEDMGIDSIVIDEGHLFKNAAMAVETKSARYLSLSEPSGRGFDAQAKAWFIRGQSPLKDGVLLLSATPITNSPLEIYSMLSLAVGHDKINDAMAGIRGADRFLAVVCDVQSENDTSIDGIERDINVFQGLNNVGVLRKTLMMFADIKDADDVGSQVLLPESEDKAIEIDLPEEIVDRLRMYKGAFRYAIDMISERAENRGDPQAFEEVSEYFGEPDALIAHPFNLINKMTMLIIDPDLDKRGTFFTFSEANRALAESVVDAFNAKKIKEKRSRPGPMTSEKMILAKKVTKNAETEETKVKYTIQVEASIAKNRIIIDTMDSQTQTAFEDLCDKKGLDLNVSIPPKLAALLENVQNEASNPRGVDEDGNRIPFAKQIIFCDILAVHNKIKRILAKRAGISASSIAIITGKTNNSPDEIMDVQVGFNASGEDNKYRIIIANEKAEVGINLQIGTQAIHHLTIGFTPDSLTQRNGRGVRQGNKTERVSVYHYDASGTFDVAKRSMVDKKSEWIGNVMDANGSDNVEIKGGLSREQQEALIDIVGDADGMTRLRDSMAAKEAEARATTNRDKQLVNISTIEKQLDFIKANPNAQMWAIKKIQALYAMYVQLSVLRNRLAAAKTETAAAKNKAALADMEIRYTGLKRHIEASVTLTAGVGIEYMTLDKFLPAVPTFWQGGKVINDKIMTKLRGNIIVDSESELQSDWQSEFDFAHAMIDESKASFTKRSKETGGYPESVIDAVASKSAVIYYGKPIFPGVFIYYNDHLVVIKDPSSLWGGVYWESDIGGGAENPEELAKLSLEIIYPGTPAYVDALMRCAEIEDEMVIKGNRKTPYSDIVPEVKNYRKQVGIAAYNKSKYMLPAPYFPVVMMDSVAPVKKAIFESQKGIVKGFEYETFLVGSDVEIKPINEGFNTAKAMRDFATAKGLRLTPEDIDSMLNIGFKAMIADEINIDDFKAAIKAETAEEVRSKAESYIAEKIASWYDSTGWSFITGLSLPVVITTAISDVIKAIASANDKPDDTVAVSGSGTRRWKDELKDYGSRYKQQGHARGYYWDGHNKQWLISRAAWDAFIAKNPQAEQSLTVKTSYNKL